MAGNTSDETIRVKGPMGLEWEFQLPEDLHSLVKEMERVVAALRPFAAELTKALETLQEALQRWDPAQTTAALQSLNRTLDATRDLFAAIEEIDEQLITLVAAIEKIADDLNRIPPALALPDAPQPPAAGLPLPAPIKPEPPVIPLPPPRPHGLVGGAGDILLGGAGGDWPGRLHAIAMEHEERWRPIMAEIDKFRPVMLELAEHTQQFGALAQRLLSTLKDALIDFAETGKFEWRDLARVALDSIEEMLLAWIRLRQQQADGAGGSPWPFILDAAGSALGGLSGGGSPSAPSAGSQFTAAGAAFLQGRLAEGGPVSPFRPYLVGEEGPELFIPRIPGEVVPNRALAAGPAAPPIVVHQHLNVMPGVPEAVRREVTAMLPQIAQAARGAVMNDLDRNSAIRRRLS